MLGEDLTLDERREIASLRNNQGFQLLLTVLDAEIQTLSDQLITTEDPEKALRKLRQWQIIKRIRQLLSTCPEEIFQELQENGQLYNYLEFTTYPRNLQIPKSEELS